LASMARLLLYMSCIRDEISNIAICPSVAYGGFQVGMSLHRQHIPCKCNRASPTIQPKGKIDQTESNRYKSSLSGEGDTLDAHILCSHAWHTSCSCCLLVIGSRFGTSIILFQNHPIPTPSHQDNLPGQCTQHEHHWNGTGPATGCESIIRAHEADGVIPAAPFAEGPEAGMMATGALA
jgi:hypothetical protein